VPQFICAASRFGCSISFGFGPLASAKCSAHEIRPHFIVDTAKFHKLHTTTTLQQYIAATMDIRLLHPSDIPHVQQTNITNLPENYFCKYYMYHALSWPQLSYVAVDVRTTKPLSHLSS